MHGTVKAYKNIDIWTRWLKTKIQEENTLYNFKTVKIGCLIPWYFKKPLYARAESSPDTTYCHFLQNNLLNFWQVADSDKIAMEKILKNKKRST